MRSQEFITTRSLIKESIKRAHNEDWDSKPAYTYEEMIEEMDRMEAEYDSKNNKNPDITN